MVDSTYPVDTCVVNARSHMDPVQVHEYTNKGLVVDKYVRNNQEWIVPRRVMCAFFWAGIILLFTGIILLVTSKHKEGSYQAWGAVLLGLGFCLLLICLILCMHAYCVITVSDDEPPLVRMVAPPPSAAMLSLLNGHNSVPPSPGMGVDSVRPLTMRAGQTISPVSYGTVQYFTENPQPEQTNNLKSASSIQAGACSCYNKDSNTEQIYLKDKYYIPYRDSIGFSSPYVKRKLSQIDETKSEFYLENSLNGNIGNQKKTSLDSVGKLPSYNTAIKLPPYMGSPNLKQAYSYDTEVDIHYLKDDGIKGKTLERRKTLERSKKSVTFDDPTGHKRVEFSSDNNDSPSEDEQLNYFSNGVIQFVNKSKDSDMLSDNSVTNLYSQSLKSNSGELESINCSKIQSLSNRLGSPPYDNENEFNAHSGFRETQLPLNDIPQTKNSALCGGNGSTIYTASTSTTWSYVSPQTHVPLLTAISPPATKEGSSSSSSETSASTVCAEYLTNAEPVFLKITEADLTDREKQSQTFGQWSIPRLKKSTKAASNDNMYNEASKMSIQHYENRGFPEVFDQVRTSRSLNDNSRGNSMLLMSTCNTMSPNVSMVTTGSERGSISDSVTLRKPTLVNQSSNDDSSGSSKMSVYDNVSYACKTKSGGKLKHFHF